MPQLTLEFSANVMEKSNLASLLQECHLALAKILPADITACKSRAIECAHYCVGNGGADKAFVHMTLKVMPGRSAEILHNTGSQIMGIMRNRFKESLAKLDLQITLEIIELQTYFKLTN